MRLVIVVVMAAAGVSGAQAKVAKGPSVHVYVEGNAAVPFPVMNQAQSLASQMFAEIGVSLRWHAGHPAATDRNSIAINLATETASSYKPAALASALPFEGVHIWIFWDRINLLISPAKILAHVMVHEIAHVLQGVTEHAEEGIMKARWTSQDQSAMQGRPLRFTPADVARIQDGMEARARGMRPAHTERAELR